MTDVDSGALFHLNALNCRRVLCFESTYVYLGTLNKEQIQPSIITVNVIVGMYDVNVQHVIIL